MSLTKQLITLGVILLTLYAPDPEIWNFHKLFKPHVSILAMAKYTRNELVLFIMHHATGKLYFIGGSTMLLENIIL